MSGIDGKPLLVLDAGRQGPGRDARPPTRPGCGARGYEGGGPQLELLRRLAHWMMKEPELEEEALTASAEGQTVTIIRRSLSEGHDAVTITRPDGTEVKLPLTETAPGKLHRHLDGAGHGALPACRGRQEGGDRGRPLGAEASSRRRSRRRRRWRRRWRRSAAGCCGWRTARPTSARCAKAGWRPAAAGSASPRATPMSPATCASSRSCRNGRCCCSRRSLPSRPGYAKAGAERAGGAGGSSLALLAGAACPARSASDEPPHAPPCPPRPGRGAGRGAARACVGALSEYAALRLKERCGAETHGFQ